MKCLKAGELRAYLDRELAPDQLDAATAHLAACGRCRAALEDIERTASTVEQGLHHIYAEPSLLAGGQERSFAAVQARLQRGRRSSLATWFSDAQCSLRQLLVGHKAGAIAGLAVLLLIAVFAGTPMGRAAADLVSQFQTQKFKVVTVEPTQVAGAGFDLAHFGVVSAPVTNLGTPTFVNSLDEAGKRVGFPVKQPASLPTGLKQPPQIAVTAPISFSFTLDVSKARAYLESRGYKDFDLPAKFDGATITVRVPAAALLMYGPLGDPSMLLVGQVPMVTAQVTGQVSLTEMRDLVLRLPGVSPELAAQFRAIDDWTNTLPIPLPKGQASGREVDLQNGSKALVLADVQQRGAVVIWQRDGRVHAVGGPYPADDLVQVANSVR